MNEIVIITLLVALLLLLLYTVTSQATRRRVTEEKYDKLQDKYLELIVSISSLNYKPVPLVPQEDWSSEIDDEIPETVRVNSSG